MLRVQVSFISLVAWIGWHSVLLCRKRMDNTCFKSGVRERAFWTEMVVPCSFDDDNQILNLVLLLSLFNEGDCRLEMTSLVLKRSWRDKQLSKIIRHHPLGPMLCGINTYDGESVAADPYNSRRDCP